MSLLAQSITVGLCFLKWVTGLEVRIKTLRTMFDFEPIKLGRFMLLVVGDGGVGVLNSKETHYFIPDSFRSLSK